MSLIRLPEGWRQKFFVAVQKGDADEAERLILQFKSAGRANPTKKPNDQGLYPIHLAAAQGSVTHGRTSWREFGNKTTCIFQCRRHPSLRFFGCLGTT